MNRRWVADMQSRHARGDLLPPSAGLAPTEWKVPPAASAHHRLTSPPAQLLLFDLALLVIAGAALLAAFMLAGVMAWGLW